MTGFAVCGSFCTHARALSLMRALAKDGEILPILSDTAYTTDTRFGKADEFVHTVTEICGRAPIRTVAEAEPIGPLGMTDVMLIAPCTGNTLAKLAHGITDSSVTMAAKSHMRTSKPLVIALATNDAMSSNLVNIGTLLNRKGVYFVPLVQDDTVMKPHSLVCDFSLARDAIAAALQGEQLRPLFR